MSKAILANQFPKFAGVVGNFGCESANPLYCLIFIGTNFIGEFAPLECRIMPLSDIRKTFSTAADAVGTCTVFNIKGNDYRLIAWINYETQKVFIKHVLTHAEYDKED